MTFRVQNILFLFCLSGFSQIADLELLKGGSAATVTPGSQQIYTLTVTNLGPDIAQTISVVDMLPEGSTFLSASPECTYNEPLHQCDCVLTSLGPLDSFSFDITIQPAWPPSGTTVGVYVSGTDASSFQPSIYLLNTADTRRSALSINNLLANPRGVERESDDTLLIADLRDPVVNPGSGLQSDGAIVRVNRKDGSQNLVSENGLLVNPTGLVYSEGNIFVADPDSGETFGRVLQVDASSGSQTILTELGLLQNPTGICQDEDGTLLVVDTSPPFRLVRVDPLTGDQALISEGSLFQIPVAVAFEVPGTALVADNVAGIIRVDLGTGEQAVLSPPAGFEFVRAMDIEVAQNGDIYVADPLGFEAGVIHQFDPLSGQLLNSFQGGMGYQEPDGLELMQAINNYATVYSETSDPDQNNNTASHLTEIRDSGTIQINIVENIGVSDQVQLPPALLISVTENVVVDDQVQLTPALLISVTENVAVDDQVQLPPAVLISVAENVVVDDQVTLTPSTLISVVENISVGDATALLQAAMISISENIALSDQTVCTPATQISITEQIVISDMVTLQPAVMLSISEAISVSDLVEVLEDISPPKVIELRTLAENSLLFEGEETRRAITQVYVIFSKPVYDPTGDTDPDDVTNPSNYMLISDGGDGVFDTISCEVGVSPQDIAVDLGPIDYIPLKQSAVLRISNGAALTKDTYRLFVCGTTSIIDLQGQALDGNGDGTEGDDHILTFQVVATNLLANPNFDESLMDWDQQVPVGTNLEFMETVEVTGLNTSGTARMTGEGIVADIELSQCLVTDSPGWIRMGGRLLMSRSAGVPEASVVVEWYDGIACEGTLIDEWEVDVVSGDTAQEWFAFRETGRVPDGAQSAKFRVVVSLLENEAVQAYWDELYFLYDPALILFDGLEGGNLNNWTE